MRRFFLENLDEIVKIKSETYFFNKDVEHRLSSVLRMKDGDEFELIDGKGLIIEASFCASSGSKQNKKSGFKIIKQYKEEFLLSTDISLAVSIIRRERFELLIEKAVELGVNNIYPIYTEYSKPYGHESSDKLQDRWQKIADQTLSQCRRTFRCNVHEIIDLEKFNVVNKHFNDKSFDEIIALHPGYETLNSDSLHTKKRKILLLIGPEGGFSDKDINYIKSIGANIFSLNTSILRTETAAIYMLSVINHMAV